MPGYRPETWNPIVGCSKVSPGCDNCYAEKMAMRIPYMLEKSKSETYYAYSNVVNKQGWNGHTCLNTDHIDNPLQWKSPRMIFVCSMSDLFHKNVPCNWINQVMQVIRQCPQHLFIILTKRPENIKDKMTGDFPENVWLGVTAENQEMANKRIPILLQIKAAKRFVSIEPMLGPIDFDEFNMIVDVNGKKSFIAWYNEGINWIICGGESGSKARPLHPDWVRSIRNQCKKAGTAFFFKQWGEWLPMDHTNEDQYFKSKRSIEVGYSYSTNTMFRVGRKTAGDILDGEEFKEWPKIV